MRPIVIKMRTQRVNSVEIQSQGAMNVPNQPGNQPEEIPDTTEVTMFCHGKDSKQLQPEIIQAGSLNLTFLGQAGTEIRKGVNYRITIEEDSDSSEQPTE